MILLVTGAWRAEMSDLERLRKTYGTVVLMPDERGELPIAADKVDAVVCNALFSYHKIEDFTSLKLIQLTSAGLDRVPVDYVREKGIKLFGARGVYDIPMAEYAVWSVLSLIKGGAFFARNQAAHAWEKNRNIRELNSMTVLIVGCGSIGCECAVRFSGLCRRVIGVDTTAREDERFDKIYAASELYAALSAADVVVLTLPLSEETRGIINERALDCFKSDALLVNIARGALVDTAALTKALSDGKLGGAALDVTDPEPLAKDSPFWDMPNVIITPHNSFVGCGNPVRLRELVIENLEKKYD